MDGIDGPASASSATATATAMVHARPTVADLHGENHFAQVARKNWLAAKKAPKVRPDVVKKELWDELEKVDFAYPSLLVLENLQLLERYLWPGFTEDASNYHHLLLALMVNVKRRENLPSWGKPCRLTCVTTITDSPRSLHQQARRILVLLPSHPLHDGRSLAALEDPYAIGILRYRRIPVARQRSRTQRVRTPRRYFDMAHPALGRSARAPLR
jgi:hypothetical protein